MRRWLRRILIIMGAILIIVAAAFGVAVVSTTPPEGLSPDPVPAPVTFHAPEGPVSVGAAAVEITPEPATGLFLGGLGLNRRSTGVHDPLFARALVLERDGKRVALVVLDLIGLHQHHAERVRAKLAKRMDPTGVLVLATHDHSAPDTLGLWGRHPLSSGIDPAFLERALDGAARAVEKALDTCRPARLSLAVGTAPAAGVSKNKRDPELIDREVLVLAADDAKDGAPIATTVVFACHPEVLMGENTLITADFPGALLREVESRRGGTGIYLNGPLGGMVTPDVQERTWPEVERVGKAVAKVALDALATPRVLERADLAWVHQPLLVPVQNRRYIAGRRLGLLDRPFVEPGYVTSEVNVLRLGPLTLVGLPGEPLPRTGFAVKETLDGPFRAVLGLAGDELGYLIPEDAFQDEKKYRYEKSVSPGPLATKLLRETAISAARSAKNGSLDTRH
jgi:hypothetical protein